MHTITASPVNVRELRQQAKARKIPKYYRMGKARLLSALGLSAEAKAHKSQATRRKAIAFNATKEGGDSSVRKAQVKGRILRSIKRAMTAKEKSLGRTLTQQEKRAIAAKALAVEVKAIRSGTPESKPKRGNAQNLKPAAKKAAKSIDKPRLDNGSISRHSTNVGEKKANPVKLSELTAASKSMYIATGDKVTKKHLMQSMLDDGISRNLASKTFSLLSESGRFSNGLIRSVSPQESPDSDKGKEKIAAIVGLALSALSKDHTLLTHEFSSTVNSLLGLPSDTIQKGLNLLESSGKITQRRAVPPAQIIIH